MTKIEYNNKYISSINEYMDICMDYLNEVGNISYPSGFKYSGTLDNIKNGSVSNKKNISKYKDNINGCIDKINKNELELLSIINKIEDIQIKSFDFEVVWK